MRRTSTKCCTSTTATSISAIGTINGAAPSRNESAAVIGATNQWKAAVMSRVRFEGVVKEYGAVTALQPLDLEIREGEFLTLLGPSGCGKTTTLRLIAGLIIPTRGRLYL